MCYSEYKTQLLEVIGYAIIVVEAVSMVWMLNIELYREYCPLDKDVRECLM